MNRLLKYRWREDEQEIPFGVESCSVTLTTYGDEVRHKYRVKLSTNWIRKENIPELRCFVEELSDALNLLNNQE